MRISAGSEVVANFLGWQQAMNAVRTNGGTFEGWDGHGGWGGWVYDPKDGGSLVAPGEHDWYSIQLDRCRTKADILDWLSHMSKKTWMTNALLGGLVRALDDVVGFYGLVDRAHAAESQAEGA